MLLQVAEPAAALDPGGQAMQIPSFAIVAVFSGQFLHMDFEEAPVKLVDRPAGHNLQNA